MYEWVEDVLLQLTVIEDWQGVLIKLLALQDMHLLNPALLCVNLVAPITLVAHHKILALRRSRTRTTASSWVVRSFAAARRSPIASVRHWQCRHRHRQWTLQGKAEAVLWQQREDRLELVVEAVINGDVALIDGNTESAEDGANGATVWYLVTSFVTLVSSMMKLLLEMEAKCLVTLLLLHVNLCKTSYIL